MSALTVGVIIGSVRPHRMGLRVGKYFQAKLLQKGVQKVHLIDPAPLQIPLLIDRYAALPEADRTAGLRELHAKIAESDAYIVVSPEYNNSYSPVLSNVMDYFYHNEYYYKSAGIVTYSMEYFGGVRAAGPLRPFLGQLGLTTIPLTVPVPKVQNLLSVDGDVLPDAGGSGFALENGAASFVSELMWFANALKTARAKGAP
ncbi:hypothetical protein SPRG_12389 [Saprolegnia parasitica CBS 223.65]|uniref:NADPH-dependent FMN reductase-like domain-containing protein n=1 Tax=Saprolegnia parasitica (strain CBS 223.65) TaxID=695850 RepID=A0A067C4Z1_SAPPC|nr:hypothetical protein SPRG_12389 [Saprolegnia parasitica CBS 223.65]KDO21887.1 hypothetical protein SPRG_12389 [Saprolegnia parasitica CBS 223.65]|eukprot:XP_012207442.1 hypothetical protein SPRG_12389 [Saprolegnia parasitica CBS 223.65]